MVAETLCVGLVQDAASHYQAAVEVCPGYAPAYYNLGVLCSEARQVRGQGLLGQGPGESMPAV